MNTHTGPRIEIRPIRLHQPDLPRSCQRFVPPASSDGRRNGRRLRPGLAIHPPGRGEARK